MADNVLAREVVEIVSRGAQRVDKEIEQLNRRLRMTEVEAKRATASLEAMGRGGARLAQRGGDSLAQGARARGGGGGGGPLGRLGDLAGFAAAAGPIGAVAAAVKLTHPNLSSLNEAAVKLAFQFGPSGLIEHAIGAGKMLADLAIKGAEGSAEMDRYNEAVASLSSKLSVAVLPAIDAFASAIESLTPLLERMAQTVAAGINVWLDGVHNIVEGINAFARFVNEKVGKDIVPTITNPFGAKQVSVKTGVFPGPEKEPQRGFEQVQDTFKRLQLAALGDDKQAQTAENTKVIVALLRDFMANFGTNWIAALAKQRPGMAP